MLKNFTFADAMESLSPGLNVQHGWRAHTVRVSQPRGGGDGKARRVVQVLGDGGRSFTAAAAIVTVPLPVLQKGQLRFEPPLPGSLAA